MQCNTINNIYRLKMIEPKDKRTKEYKDCGCNERKEYLNRIMPFAKVECLIEDEYNWLHKYYNGKTSRIDSSTQDQFNVIYNRVFNKKVVRSTCSSCVAQRVKELRKVYDGYK